MKFEKLGNIITIAKGKKPVFAQAPSPSSIRIIQIDDLRNDDDIKYTDEKTGVYVSEDDILIAWDGANAGTVGYGKRGFIGSTIAALRKKDPHRFYTPFIGRFLQSQSQFLRDKSTGATIPHINRKSLENVPIPLITIEEQIQITNILDRAEQLISVRKECITVLDEFLKSVFLEMFGDPVRNRMGWERKPLSYLGNWKSGGTPLRSKIEYYEGDIPWITSGELNSIYIEDSKERITETAILESNASKIPIGSLLLGMYDTAALKSSITRKVVACNQAIAYAKLNEELCNVLFIYYCIQIGKDYFKSQQRGVRQQNMNLTMIKNIQVLYPPLSLQNHFVQIAEKTESLKGRYQRSLQELERLYASLIQKAFKGELDLSRLGVDYGEPKPTEEKKSTLLPGNVAEMSLDDFYDIPEEIQEAYGSIEQHVFDWEFFFKKHFADRPITTENVHTLYHTYNYERGYDFDYEEFVQVLFETLKKDNTYLLQQFNPSTKQIEIIVKNEAPPA